MKVAIIGAGLAGLACAYELEKNGIYPHIFERTSLIGENIELPAIQMKMFHTPVSNPYAHLKKEFGLVLNPSYNLNELIMKSPNKTAVIHNNLGWIFRRGSFSTSMANQLRKYVVSDIKLNSDIYYKDIKNKYSHIIVASGSFGEAEEMNLPNVTFSAWTRMATVAGSFKTDSVRVWLNTEYAKAAYAYLVPDTHERAKLVLIVNDITAYELDSYWDLFLTTEKIDYKIVKSLDLPHKVGRLSHLQMGNIYFTGLAGGFMDDFLGFGSIESVFSGLLAARSIARNLNYEKLVKPFMKNLSQIHHCRDAMNKMTNKDFDLLLSFLDIPAIKSLVYGNQLFRVALCHNLAIFYSLIKGRSK